jgi:predicted ArsR family transcriptional regulator
VDVPVRSGDPLAQPTRARLFALLCELRRPAATEELAERLELHPNGVRRHLERLQGVGLIVRERDRRPRGRPLDMWLISSKARPSGQPPTAYAQLGRWLARVIKPGRTTLGTIESTGRQIGRELASGIQGSAERSLYAALSAMGFQPRRELPSDSQGLAYRLCNCPYREAAQANPEAVCGLHHGITLGLLEALDPDGELIAFRPEDPLQAGCLIELAGPLASEGLGRLASESTP